MPEKSEKPEKVERRKHTPKVDLDLRFAPASGPLDPNAKRFDIFLVDTGWNSAVAKLVRAHITTIAAFEKQDSIYILSPEQSIDLIKRAPRLIGHDPIILVYDRYAPSDRKERAYRGFRLNLGLVKSPEQALARLQELLRFIALNRTVLPMDRAVRKELYREGLDGMVRVLRETTTELL